MEGEQSCWAGAQGGAPGKSQHRDAFGKAPWPRKPGSMVRIAVASETALRPVPTGDAKAGPGGRRKQSKNLVAGPETILNSSIQSTLESALCFFYHFLVTF